MAYRIPPYSPSPDSFSHPCSIAHYTLFASCMLFIPLYSNLITGSIGITVYAASVVLLVLYSN